MAALLVLYSRSHDPGSLLIRLAAWGGPWSHCALVVGQTVIESTLRGKGVRERSLRGALDAASAHEFVDVRCPDPEAGIAWARSQIGKPYDLGGVLGIAARARRWQDDSRWYCSELVERALIEAGRTRWRDRIPGISPCMSYYAR